MLYDLNIPWTPSLDRAALEQTLAFASSLGYDVVALNHTVSPPIPAQISNPLPRFDGDDDDDNGASPSSSVPRTAASASQPPTRPTGAPSPPSRHGRRRLPTVLRRATVVLDDPSQNFRVAALAGHYDILAVRPTTERAFANACLNSSEFSLISLDLSHRFNFHFRPKPCMAAVSRGVRFEVCYAQALAPGPAARANFIANLASLARATRGRGLVVSSEAASALALRGPADVANLLSVWGLPKEKGMEALGAAPRSVVVNERLKRSSYKGVVDIVETAPRPAPRPDAVDAADTKGKPGRQQKRKKDDLTSGPSSQASAAAGTVSKRQAKKMRIAQQQQK